MCGRDVNIEISETYQTGIFFRALINSRQIIPTFMGDNKKRVYRFGGCSAEGDGTMRNLLGGIHRKESVVLQQHKRLTRSTKSILIVCRSVDLRITNHPYRLYPVIFTSGLLPRESASYHLSNTVFFSPGIRLK